MRQIWKVARQTGSLVSWASGGHWTGPVPTAVRALAIYIARGQETSPDFQAHVLLNGHPVRTLTLTRESLTQPEASFDITGTALQSGENTVTLQKIGPGRLYYSLTLKQCRTQPPRGRRRTHSRRLPPRRSLR